MSDQDAGDLSALSVDTDNLYREESFTDLRAASIRRLTPVKPDGADDESRDVAFIGETTLLTQVGPLPIQCNIDARSLSEAFENFPEAVKQALERMNERAQEMRREEASKIVVPSAVPPGVGGVGGGAPGAPGAPGTPGRGKIILDK